MALCRFSINVWNHARDHKNVVLKPVTIINWCTVAFIRRIEYALHDVYVAAVAIIPVGS